MRIDTTKAETDDAEAVSEPKTPNTVAKEKETDGQTKAVLMMNLYCLANTLQCVLYKIMAERGVVDLMEYTWFRNATILALALTLLILQARDPVAAGKAMRPKTRKLLLLRAILGYLITLLINACLSMIPFSLLVILFQTSPFWTSFLSYYVNGEPIYGIEIMGMILCFVAVIIITMAEQKD